MPRIREYNVRSDVAGPVGGRRASAQDFGAGVMGGFADVDQAVARASAVIQQRQEQLEVTDLHAKAAELQAQADMDLHTELNKANPSDRSFVERYKERLDETLSKFYEGATTPAGRNYATRAGAVLRGRLVEKAFAGQAAAAAGKAKADWQTARNRFANVLTNDPSAFSAIMQLHNEGIEGLVASGLLPRVKAQELKQQGEADLAEATVRGWINTDPAHAAERLKSGAYADYLTGDQQRQLTGEAGVAMNAMRVEDERRKKAEKEAQEAAQMERQNEFLAKLQSNKLSVKEVLASDLKPFGPGSKEQFIGMIKQAAKERGSAKTDPALFRNLFAGIHDNKITNENDLNQYVVQGRLSMEDLMRLRGEIQGRRTSEGRLESDLQKGFFDMAKKQITGSSELTGIADPKGDELYYQFQVYVLREYKKQRDAGKDPVSLLDPGSPDYLGKKIAGFRRTPDEMVRDMAAVRLGKPLGSAARPADDPKARKPGESPADYLRRTGRTN